ncbi:uncharacterized protein LOC143234273 isoform X1 [Tachypleus tridentatus]|uniref:uncharacterized protein LOC143234273 isoform X1 n=1 Tax=Tachypleus tridentatus TaxID=6853 RepID=UPI003FD4D91F
MRVRTYNVQFESSMHNTESTKEKLLRPYFVSYRDLLHRNIEEVVRQLATTDPAYFLSVLELLQGRNCSRVDFKQIDVMFKSPGIEPVVKEFWRVWGHEQISRQVFPVTVTNVSLAKPLYNAIPGMFRTLPDVSSGSININAFPHVPIKEGLHSVIKCLKTQDISQSKTKSDLVDTKPRSCVCSVCKIPSLASRPSSRLRMYGEFNVKNNHQTSPPQGSAFHLPVHHIMSAEDSQENLPHHSFRFSSTSVFPYSPFTSQRNRFREYLAIKNHASSKSIDFPYGVPTGHIRAAFVEPRASDVSIPTSVVQPIPHYLSLGLKSYEPVMRPYSMINKVEYPVTTGPYQNGFG